MKPIYLDYAATAPLRPEARDAMDPFLDDRFGNPASVHRWGRDARAGLEEARSTIAEILGVKPSEICFTGGGTESNNIALHGAAAMGSGAIVRSAIEHSSIREPSGFLARHGRTVIEVPVDADGTFDAEAVEAAVGSNPVALVSLMSVNNETGAIQPIAEVVERLRGRGVLIHSDMVQALGKFPIDLGDSGLGMASFSAHKIGGPRGVGVLYRREDAWIDSPFQGGGQEWGVRSGTVNVAGAVGFAAALVATEKSREEEIPRLAAMRDRAESRVVQATEAVINAASAPRVASVSSIRVPHVARDALLMSLDLEGVAVSSGSACSSGGTLPSRVLAAMGIDDQKDGPSVRLSMGWQTTEKEIDRGTEALIRVVARLREMESV